MWSNLALLVALWYVPSSVVDAQLFTGSSCSICPTTLPEVGLPDVVLDAGFAGVLLEDQTCGETEELAQAGAFSRASCVLLRTSGISNICGCQEADAPIPVPVAVPTRRPVAAPVAVPTDAPEPAPTEAPVAATTDAPEPAPTGAPVVAPTDAPVVVVAPTETPVVVVAPTETPVVVVAPTETPVAVVTPTVAPITLTPSMVNLTSDAPSTMVPIGTAVPTTTKVPTMASSQPASLTPAETQVVIRLSDTSGPLTESATTTFLEVCAEFYTKYLPVAAMNVTCEIPARRLENVQRTFRLRALQAQTLAPLDVTTNVMAIFDENAGVIAFADVLIETTTTNSMMFATQLRTRGEGVSQVYFQNVKEVAAFDPMSVPPVSGPVPAPSGSSPVAASPVAPPPTVVEEESGSDRLSTGAIVGIIVGVLGGIAIFGGGAYLASQSNPEPTVRAVHTDPVGEDFPSPHAKPSAPLVTKSYEKEPAPVPPAATAAAATAAAAAATEGNKDGMSVMTGSEMDAYSLDAGNVDQPSSAPGTKRDTVDGMSQSGDEMSSHAMSSLRQNMVSRTVVAPPGKLGIVIDTTLEGPVVHKINPQSPLEGTLFPGDIIVAIDDVDTRAMSASAITALMVRTANLRRKLTVLSEDVTN